MKFIYETVTLKSDHPQWPNAVGYKLKNVQTNELSLAFYLQENEAIKYMNKCNERGY